MYYWLLPLLLIMMIGIWGMILFNSFGIVYHLADLLAILEAAFN